MPRLGLNLVSLAAVSALTLGSISAAEAKCTRLGFLVNDYGKDGPTKDAKELLDKHIIEWAKEHNIPKYTVGKKDVSCELFLNFIVFDEHTCKASADVCWPEGAPAKSTNAKAPASMSAPKPLKSNSEQKSVPKGRTAVKSATATE